MASRIATAKSSALIINEDIFDSTITIDPKRAGGDAHEIHFHFSMDTASNLEYSLDDTNWHAVEESKVFAADTGYDIFVVIEKGDTFQMRPKVATTFNFGRVY